MSTPARRRLLPSFRKSKQCRCHQTCFVTESPKKNTRRPGFRPKMCCMHTPDTHRYAAFILLAAASGVGNEEGAVCRTAQPYRRPGGGRLRHSVPCSRGIPAATRLGWGWAPCSRSLWESAARTAGQIR
eukprot:scaffold3281_cov286-Prasinococcus_capsulatus_cf.AAC.12